MTRCSKIPGQQCGRIAWLFASLLLLFFIQPSCSETNDSEYPPKDFSGDDPAAGQMKEEGSPSILTCQTNSDPSPKYRWLKDGVYLTNRSSINFYQIERIQRDEAGKYRCEASNPLGAILSLAADVQVAYFGEFANTTSTIPLSTSIGNAVIIAMPYIESNPPPSLITWIENDQPMIAERVRYKMSLNGSLVLLDRTLSDSNSYYQVQALNGIVGRLQYGPVYSLTISGSTVTNLPPSIVIGPEDQTAIEGRDTKAEFECIFNARPVGELQIRWYKVVNETKTQISNSGKYILSSISGRTLTIKNPRPEDNARYQCEAMTLQFLVPVIASAELIVYVSPTFGNMLFPTQVNRDFGQTVTLNCTAVGHPTPTKHWYFNALELGKDFNSSYTLYENGSLTVVQLDMEHAGMYQCFLRNAAGEKFKATWLKVNSSPPTMITPPQNETTIEGGDVRFTCNTRGAPKPEITWSRVTSSGAVEAVTTFILENGDLYIMSANPSDSGLYTCNASNSQGFVTASAHLTVMLRTQINQPPQDQRIIKGSTALFYCGVSHDPSIQVTWQWTHHSLQVSVVIIPDGRRVISPDGTLSIIGVNNNDIGDYTCDVISNGGNDTRTVSLTVIELPHAPIINSVSLHVSDVRAVVVRWTPQYDGNAPITAFSIQYKEVRYGSEGDGSTDLVWITFTADIPPDARETVVTGLRPARYYQFRVFASNEVGEGRSSTAQPVPAIEMPQQPPSSPPKGFYGMPATNTSVTLMWQPPSEETWNGPLLGYNIHYKLAGYPNNTFQQVNVSLMSLPINPRYQLDRLAYFQEYEIQIAAYNAEGIGMYSSLIHVMTLEGHPTAPPVNLQAHAVNSTTVQATWNPPNQQYINGISLGYKVLGRRSGIQHNEFVVVVPQDSSDPNGEQSTLLHKLLKYTEYTMTVVCFTSQGDGPEAVPATVKTQEDVPSSVAYLNFTDIQATSLQVNWGPPTSLNGILTGYTLMYEEKDVPDSKQTVNLLPGNHSRIISNLRSVTKYTIYVSASTAKGAGQARSADIESGVPPEYPTAPFNLGVSNIEARSVLLQFLPGFDGKTSITLWIVEALEGLEATTYKIVFEKSDPDVRSIQVQNLKPYTHYKLRIIAENVKGRSNASDPTRLFQTLQDAPGAPPGNLTVRALNATALRVSWTPLPKSDWNGEPKGYKIFYRMKESTSTDWSQLNLYNGVNMNSAILGQLEEWMEYEVKMLAYNDVGDSVFSTVTIERTRESVPSVGPINVSALAITPTSVNVSWGEVDKLQQNGMILGFKVWYRSSEAGIPRQSWDVPGNTTTSAIVPYLRKFITYEVRVLAYTRMGDGVPSVPEVLVKTLADVPGPPRIIWFPYVSFNNATIEWEPPEEPNGIILNYNVSYKLRDSQQDYINETVQAEVRRLTVNNLQRQAYYEFRVMGTTTKGWGESSTVEVFTMENRSPPYSPTNLDILQSQLQARAVTISWIPAAFNGYGPLRNFTVQYKTNTGSWTSVQETILPSTTTYTVHNLKPNTGYVFQVAATNDVGTSPFSDESIPVKTLEDKPDGPPRYVKVDRLNTTSVEVTWEQPLPSTWNGELRGYVLMYRQVESLNYMEENFLVHQTSTTLTNLVKFVNYEFLLKAYNDVGQGPTSTPVTVFVGEAAPSAPPVNVGTQSINSTEIRVTWQPPPLETHNGELSGYQIAYWLATESAQNAKHIVVPSSELSWVLKYLNVFTDYAITVRAINLAGEGPQSDVKYNKTQEGVPGIPARMSFWNVTFTSLEVEWGPPERPNGKITNYELSYLEQNIGGSKQVKFNVSGNVTLLSISDLIEGALYTFSVTARTSVGPGLERESTLKIGPRIGAPTQPTDVTFHQDGQLLTLQWVNVLNDQSSVHPIYGHLIQANSSDPPRWQTVAQVGRDTRAEINLLSQFSPNTWYQLRVVALNRIGMSQPSEVSSMFKTPAPAPPSVDLSKSKPFHYEWWFLVIVALTGLIIILVIISLLCLISRRGKKQKVKTPGTMSSTSNLAPSTTEPEEGGFNNLEMARQSTHSRRQKFAGIRPNGAANNIYARSPPRPSPASVAYSDDDTASAVKPPLPDDDDDDSSCTEKPSELGDTDTEASDEASDDDSLDLPLPPPPPASPPPPPFSDISRPPYIPSRTDPRHTYGAAAAPTDTGQNHWNSQNQSFNAYQYTDSEAESSHYAFSLNGGQIMLNNTAGSRAPLPGFSSFV